MKTCRFCKKRYATSDRRRKYCAARCYWKYNASHPNSGQFKRGIHPWNKGKCGLHFSPRTEFKKGQPGINWVPVGTLSVRRHHGDSTRTWIKISEPNKWEEYAKFVWKKAFGHILPHDVVHHLDGNSRNDALQNLLALPRTDHPVFHNRWGIKPINEKQRQFYRKRYKS